MRARDLLLIALALSATLAATALLERERQQGDSTPTVQRLIT